MLYDLYILLKNVSFLPLFFGLCALKTVCVVNLYIHHYWLSNHFVIKSKWNNLNHLKNHINFQIILTDLINSFLLISPRWNHEKFHSQADKDWFTEAIKICLDKDTIWLPKCQVWFIPVDTKIKICLIWRTFISGGGCGLCSSKDHKGEASLTDYNSMQWYIKLPGTATNPAMRLPNYQN